MCIECTYLIKRSNVFQLGNKIQEVNQSFHFFKEIPTSIRYTFSSNHKFIKVRVAFIFGPQILLLMDFTKFFQLKGLDPQKMTM